VVAPDEGLRNAVATRVAAIRSDLQATMD